MPTSEKLLAAARENAKNSTGSRTPANTGSPPKIDHMEDPADLEAHRNAIHTLYNPQNQMGLFWVDQIVLAMWRIDKLIRWESGIFNDAISKTWEDNTDQDDEDAEDLEQYVTNIPPHEKHGVQKLDALLRHASHDPQTRLCQNLSPLPVPSLASHPPRRRRKTKITKRTHFFRPTH